MGEIEKISAEKVAEGLIFGEGIRWTGSEVVLSDMAGQRVVKVYPSNGKVETLYVLEGDNCPNGLVCLDDGSLLIMCMFDRKIIKFKEGVVSEYADLSKVTTGYLGDVVMDAQGNLYVDDVGIRPFHGEALAPIGRVILVKTNGEISVVLENLDFPNGITISPDGKTLYLVESFELHAYDIEKDCSLSGGRFHSKVEGHKLDGMGIDDESGVWLNVTTGNQIVRFDKSGVMTHEISLPGIAPIACTIGGEDGKTMFITGFDEIGDKNIFDEIKYKRLKTSIWKAKVPFTNAKGRP
ncbi:MAG: SMP-30/gluconolactonase/LRE family protein [Pseudomonadota bacterium]